MNFSIEFDPTYSPLAVCRFFPDLERLTQLGRGYEAFDNSVFRGKLKLNGVVQRLSCLELLWWRIASGGGSFIIQTEIRQRNQRIKVQ